MMAIFAILLKKLFVSDPTSGNGMTRTQWAIIVALVASIAIVFCIGIGLLVNRSAPRSTPITIAEVTTTSVSISRLNPTNTPQQTILLQPSLTLLPSSTQTPATTSTRTLVPTHTATSTSTSKPQPTNSPRPTVRTFLTFNDGTKIVGTDIPAGTYRGNIDSDFCYWKRVRGFGGTTDEIIANDLTLSPTVVTIAKTDTGFSSNDCGGFTEDLSPITSSPSAPFGDGTYIVGKDIAPGRWRSSGGQGCYWKRLNGFGGITDNIIANNIVNGQTIIEIGTRDAGFSSTRCGTWTKIN